VPELSPVATWLPIPGWEGMYEVSDLGRVRSIDRIAPLGSKGAVRRYRGVELRPQLKRDGYIQVCLARNGRHSWVMVHRLVLLAFVGPAPEGMECCHGNHDPWDNRLVNLRWGTQLENFRDVVQSRRHRNLQKMACPRRHPLAGANLLQSASTSTPGERKRECRSCRNAQKRICHAARRGWPLPDLQKLSDEIYARLCPA
jgi:hypothetical protein